VCGEELAAAPTQVAAHPPLAGRSRLQHAVGDQHQALVAREVGERAARNLLEQAERRRRVDRQLDRGLAGSPDEHRCRVTTRAHLEVAVRLHLEQCDGDEVLGSRLAHHGPVEGHRQSGQRRLGVADLTERPQDDARLLHRLHPLAAHVADERARSERRRDHLDQVTPDPCLAGRGLVQRRALEATDQRGDRPHDGLLCRVGDRREAPPDVLLA
jgi:hypothetical protein